MSKRNEDKEHYSPVKKTKGGGEFWNPVAAGYLDGVKKGLLGSMGGQVYILSNGSLE